MLSTVLCYFSSPFVEYLIWEYLIPMIRNCRWWIKKGWKKSEVIKIKLRIKMMKKCFPLDKPQIIIFLASLEKIIYLRFISWKYPKFYLSFSCYKNFIVCIHRIDQGHFIHFQEVLETEILAYWHKMIWFFKMTP